MPLVKEEGRGTLQRALAGGVQGGTNALLLAGLLDNPEEGEFGSGPAGQPEGDPQDIAKLLQLLQQLQTTPLEQDKPGFGRTLPGMG